MFKYKDFAVLTEAIKAMDEDEKSGLLIHEDEGIVFVIDGHGETLFSAEAINFVHAYFVLLDVDIDVNLAASEENRV